MLRYQKNPHQRGGRSAAALRTICWSVVYFSCLLFPSQLLSQSKRMVVDGSIRLEGGPLPSTALIRILHSDSTIGKTISIYDPFKGKFGVRLSSQDGFEDEEKILFRVVLSPKDSFLARVVTPASFRGSHPPIPAPTVKAELFRNHVPQLRRLIPDTSISENQPFRYRLVAIDFDGDTISYRIYKAPPDAEINSITGLFTWTPDFEKAGMYELVFTVGDGFDVDTSNVTILTVHNFNRPPYFTRMFPDTVILEGQTLRFQVAAEDSDEDPVRFSSLRTPSSAVFDSLGGWFEWTPTYEQSGQHTMSISAQDGQGVGTTRTVRITVLNVNRAPVFTKVVADTSVDENQEIVLQYTGNDPDGDKTRFFISVGTPGVMVTPNGILRWKPNFLQAGNHKVTIAVSDDSLQTSATTHIRVVNVNHVPTLPRLLRPAETDTLQLNSAKPVVFVWNRSYDEDTDDTLRYTVRITGELLDTTMTGMKDSAVALNLRPRLMPSTVYRWNLSVSDGWLTLPVPETFTFRTSAASGQQKEGAGLLPRVFSLEHNYPNPFNPTTSIRYAIPERSFVKVTVWNMLGELVQELVSEEKEAGSYESTFRAENLPSGVYLVKLEAHPVSGLERKDFISTKKMILVK